MIVVSGPEGVQGTVPGGVALVPVLNVAAQFVGPVAAAVPWALLLVALGYLATVRCGCPTTTGTWLR